MNKNESRTSAYIQKTGCRVSEYTWNNQVLYFLVFFVEDSIWFGLTSIRASIIWKQIDIIQILTAQNYNFCLNMTIATSVKISFSHLFTGSHWFTYEFLINEMEIWKTQHISKFYGVCHNILIAGFSSIFVFFSKIGVGGEILFFNFYFCRHLTNDVIS